MNLIKGSLENPIARFMVAIGIVMLGLVAFSNLAIDLFPDITLPAASVVTQYSGASPEDIEFSVTRAIERAVARIQNVKTVSSYSREGISLVTIQFNWRTNLDAAVSDVEQSVNQILDQLPEESERPIILKFDPSQQAIITLALTGSMSPWKLRELAEDFVEPRLETQPGVASASVGGGRVREIKVELDRGRVEASGLTMDQVVSAVRAANVDLPGGNLKVGKKDFIVRTVGRSIKPEELEQIVINRTTVPIRLRDIARVRDGLEDEGSRFYVNGGRAVTLSVQKQPGSNTVAVADAVMREVPRIQRDLPPGVGLEFVNDQSRFIRSSVKNLQHEAMIGAILATVIVLVFLRNFRSTLIISLSIPISITTAFVLLYFNNMTLNIMTLGGLALGVGRLVDDSIVVLENVYRHMEAGESPREASYNGATEVSRPVVAATVTSVIVFLPVAFTQGVTSLLFTQMAFTVAFALMASLFESLTLVPVLTSKFLRTGSRKPGRRPFIQALLDRSQKAFDTIDEKYQTLLQWALAHRTRVIGTVLALFVGSIAIPYLGLIGSELFPTTDEGQFAISVRLPVGTRMEETSRQVERVQAIVMEKVPELWSMSARAGSGVGRSAIFSGRFSGTHTGRVNVRLVPLTERRRSVEQIMNSLRPELTRIAGAMVTMSAGGAVSSITRFGTEEDIDVEIQGYNLDQGKGKAQEIRRILERVPGVTDIQISREEGLPGLRFDIDHERVAALGLTVAQIGSTVKTAVDGTNASVFVDPQSGREHNVRVQLREEDRRSIEDLERIFVGSRGKQIPLSNVAYLHNGFSPTQIERKYQQRIVHVTASVTERDLGSVASEIEAGLRSVRVPKDFTIQLKGAREEQQQSFRQLVFALIGSVALVYMVLAAQYGSLLHPLIIMFSVPLGLIGVIWALFLTHTTLSIISFIGIIMMVGIVVSNAILLVEYTNQLRERGLGLHEAVVQAGRTRLRPILMTTLTTILGLLPMALGIGEGAEANAPLGISVIGGLTVSTFLTLVFVPTLYTVLEMRRRKAETTPASASPIGE